MQFNGYERRAIAMRTESCARKTFLGLQALLFLVFYAGAGSLYIIHAYNANEINNLTDICELNLLSGTLAPTFCDMND